MFCIRNVNRKHFIGKLKFVRRDIADCKQYRDGNMANTMTHRKLDEQWWIYVIWKGNWGKWNRYNNKVVPWKRQCNKFINKVVVATTNCLLYECRTWLNICTRLTIMPFLIAETLRIIIETIPSVIIMFEKGCHGILRK